MDIDQQKLYTTKEAAEALGISEITAKRHVMNGTIPSIKIGGSRRIPGKEFVSITQIKRVKPKGGCELVYSSKREESEIINALEIKKFREVEKYGSGNNGHLILGDNLHVLHTLTQNSDIHGKVDLIYIDPPFGTGQDFFGPNDEGYSDRLVRADFLEFIRERLILLRDLLSDNGSIYLHIDTKIGHYVKILLDEIFGEENFRNEITRIKCNPKNFDRKAFGNIKDVIFFYSKSKSTSSDQLKWPDYRLPLTEEEIEKQFAKIDKTGRRYTTTPLHAKGETKNGSTGQSWKGLMPPKGRHWRYAPTELTRLDEAGLIEWSSTGNPRKIIFADENPGKKLQDVWDFKDPGYEKSSYPTEKNIDLLKQIVLASSHEDDLILDCFCGSGTTLVAAEQLKRRWIGIDQNPDAIKTVRGRLLNNEDGSLFSQMPHFKISEAI